MIERTSAATALKAQDDQLIFRTVQSLRAQVREIEGMVSHFTLPQHLAFLEQALFLLDQCIAQLLAESKQPLTGLRSDTSANAWCSLQNRVRGMLPQGERRLLDRLDVGLTGTLYLYLQVLESNPQSSLLRETLQQQQATFSQAQRDLRVLIGYL